MAPSLYTFAPGAMPYYTQLTGMCLASAPAARPTFANMCRVLKVMLHGKPELGLAPLVNQPHQQQQEQRGWGSQTTSLLPAQQEWEQEQHREAVEGSGQGSGHTGGADEHGAAPASEAGPCLTQIFLDFLLGIASHAPSHAHELQGSGSHCIVSISNTQSSGGLETEELEGSEAVLMMDRAI